MAFITSIYTHACAHVWRSEANSWRLLLMGPRDLRPGSKHPYLLSHLPVPGGCL